MRSSSIGIPSIVRGKPVSRDITSLKYSRWKVKNQEPGGMQSCPGGLLSHINIEEFENLPMQGKAYAIYTAFLEPLEGYRLSSPSAKRSLEDHPEFLHVSEERVLKLLQKLNHLKGYWSRWNIKAVVKDYAILLTFLNSSPSWMPHLTNNKYQSYGNSPRYHYCQRRRLWNINIDLMQIHLVNSMHIKDCWGLCDNRLC